MRCRTEAQIGRGTGCEKSSCHRSVWVDRCHAACGIRSSALAEAARQYERSRQTKADLVAWFTSPDISFNPVDPRDLVEHVWLDGTSFTAR